MKAFIFSKRFLIPFFIVWITHVGYLAWEIWQLYEDDFNGKGLAPSLKYEWLLLQISGQAILLSFLLAFFIGIAFYSHYRMKKDETAYPFISPINHFVVFIISISGGFFIHRFASPGILKNLFDCLHLLCIHVQELNLKKR